MPILPFEEFNYDDDKETLIDKLNEIKRQLEWAVNYGHLDKNNVNPEIRNTVNNFNNRTDRDGTAITLPTIATDGTAIDHTINTDGSCNISFEWSWTGNNADISGWIVYVRQGDTNAQYNFGDSPAEEQAYGLPSEKRAFFLYGVPANKYYTFGIQAYRKVDPDVDTGGVIKTAIVKPTLAAENPYQPSANVAFAGNVTGTVNNVPVSTLIAWAGNGETAYTGTVKYRTDGVPTNNPTPSGITIATNANATINIKLEWLAYTQGSKQADFIMVFWKKGDGAPTVNDSSITFNVNTTNASYYIFEGINPADTYSFGIAAARRTENGLEIGPIQSPTSNPDWQGVTVGTPNYTGNVNGTQAATVTTAVTNFNSRNDRKTAVPANPVIAGDGTAIDHTINTDGSADISFEWSFSGSGDAYDIDGFLVYVRASTSSNTYTFGSTPSEEQVYYVTSEKRAFILPGVAANLYYTFGIQAYRVVDQDINASGLLKSSIVKSTATGENPYQPSANVAFAGNVTGTVNNVPVSTLIAWAGNGETAYTGTVKYRTDGVPTNNPTPSGITIATNANATINIKLEWLAYTQGSKQADFIMVFWKKGDGAPTVNDSSITFNVNTTNASYYIFEGINPADTYSFGIAAARRTENGLEIGPIQSPTSNPDWQGVTVGTPNYTGNVNGTQAATVTTAVTNFNSRNDRKTAVPANPVIAGDGTAIDHTINTDGSADISFEWSFSGSGDAYDIDGFLVYVRASTSSNTYTFGSTPSEEQVYYVTSEKRAFILPGVAANLYYTFGIQAYRVVDQDINASGLLKSSIVKSTATGENPYQPSANVAFAGNVTGTINGIPGDSISKTPGTLIVADGSTTLNTKRADYVVQPGSVSAETVINQAINALPANGGKVVLLEGTYTISGSIIIKSNVTLEGQGPSTVIKLANENSSNTRMITNAVSTDVNIMLNSFVLDGNKDNVTNSPTGIYLTGQNVVVSGHVIKNVWLRNHKYGPMMLFSLNGTTITSCFWTNNPGYNSIYGYNLKNCNIANNVIKNSQGISLFKLNNISMANTITGNVIDGCDKGINLTETSNNTISGNTLQNINGSGIILDLSNNNTITGNICRVCSNTGITLLRSSNNSLIGNVCSENSTSANNVFSNIELIAVDTVASNYNNIQNNVCRAGSLVNKPKYGVLIGATCTGNFICNNDLTNSGVTGAIADYGTNTNTTAGNKTA